MKRSIAAALVLVIMAAMLTGCGCMNSAAPTQSTTMPTVMPTTQATRPTETSRPTQQPSSQPTAGMDSTGANENAGTAGTGSTDDSGMTETTTPMTRNSGSVRSHVGGDF